MLRRFDHNRWLQGTALVTDDWVPYRVREAGPADVATWKVLQEEFSVQLDKLVRGWCNDVVDFLDVGVVGRINNRLGNAAVTLKPRQSPRHPYTVRVADESLLDVLDLLVHLLGQGGDFDGRDIVFVVRLARDLDEGRSVYEVRPDLAGTTWCLGRRVDLTVADQAATMMAAPGTAADYLSAAWHACYDLHPDYRQALDRSIDAVEAAARPIISPSDAAATLTKMRNALRDKPVKWATTLGSVDQLRQRLTDLAAIQQRHGVSDPAAVRHITRQEALAALHEAVTLVHAFTNGLIVRTDDQ